ATEREIGGLRCSQVLEHLSDLLDDDLSPELRERIEAHLSGCAYCDKFGGEMSRLVGAAREHLRASRSADREAAILDALRK
ncbi:MAG: zf-HC2 domain-containing protein, partial [Myxococcota bacterium]